MPLMWDRPDQQLMKVVVQVNLFVFLPLLFMLFFKTWWSVAVVAFFWTGLCVLRYKHRATV